MTTPSPPARGTLAGALAALLRGVLLGIAAIVVSIEEWGWRPLAAVMARLTRWAPLARLEGRVRVCSPRIALCLFVVPAVLLFPLKLAALWLIHGGHGLLGVGIIVLAKLLGTALVGRLFVLAEPQLMRFAWLARAIGWWQATKLRVAALLAQWAPWQRSRRLARRLRMSLRRWRRLRPRP